MELLVWAAAGLLWLVAYAIACRHDARVERRPVLLDPDALARLEASALADLDIEAIEQRLTDSATVVSLDAAISANLAIPQRQRTRADDEYLGLLRRNRARALRSSDSAWASCGGTETSAI